MSAWGQHRSGRGWDACSPGSSPGDVASRLGRHVGPEVDVAAATTAVLAFASRAARGPDLPPRAPQLNPLRTSSWTWGEARA